VSIRTRLGVLGRLTDPIPDSCSPGELKASVPQWVFYLLAMVFDSTTVSLSSFFLIRSAPYSRCVPVYLITTPTRLTNLVEYPQSSGCETGVWPLISSSHTIIWFQGCFVMGWDTLSSSLVRRRRYILPLPVRKKTPLPRS